jgi:hypothetical protein
MIPNDPPTDMMMMLRLIDSKFETMTAKIDGLQSTLTALSDRFVRYDEKFDTHEQRLQAIEGQLEARKLMIVEYQAVKDDVDDLLDWKISEQTTSKNALSWGAIAWDAAKPLVVALLTWLAAIYYSHAQLGAVEHREKTTVESVSTAPPKIG